MGISRFWFPVVVVAVAFGPLAFFLGHSFQIDSAPEFVYYRIGDALSLMGGEGAYVRPIQGIPNAILSKLSVWLVGDSVVTRDGSRVYGLIFSVLLAVPVVASIVYAWRKLPVSVALAQALILSLPIWFGTASDGLMVAPDYWQAELAYLGITLPLLYSLRDMPADRGYLVAGIWTGLGVSIKVTLFPVALLFLIFLGQWKPGRIRVMLGAAFLAFVALDLIYMANPEQALQLLQAQARFFLRPNHSAFYPDFLSAFMFRPIVPMLAAALLVLCLVKRNSVALALLGWVAVYLYLIARRPHDTSMASFAISLGFMVALAALQFERKALLILAGLVALAALGAGLDHFSAIRTITDTGRQSDSQNVARADAFFRPTAAVWFMPSNDWNATYGPQGLALNGGLAVRPRHERATLQKLFPGVDVALTLEEVPALFIAGAPVYWTRPVDSDAGPLFAALSGARIEEQHGTLRGMEWIFGKAQPRP